MTRELDSTPLGQQAHKNPAEIVEEERRRVTAEVISRFSVLDLIEMSDKDIANGEKRLFRATKPVKILEKGETELIRWWIVEGSSGEHYHVRRFENFVYCSCPDFFYGRTVDRDGNKRPTLCKHLTITLKWYCRRCRKRDVDYGSLCVQCQMDTAPWLKATKPTPVLKVGNIRLN